MFTNEENLHKEKILPGEFQVITLEESTNQDQAVISIRNFTTTLPIPKYQPTVEPLFQSPVGLNLVEVFSFA